MKSFRFKKLDAFAARGSEGNPAGYIRMDSSLDICEIEMQQIAKELKGYVTEVGFLSRESDTLFRLKYFSSEREVDFCGHATIAIMYDLISNDKDLRSSEVLQIITNRGRLNVENRIEKEDAVFIMSPEPETKQPLPEMNDIAENLKINIEEMDLLRPVEIMNAGLTTLLVPVNTLETILKISPDPDGLKHFCHQSGIDIVEVFTDDVVNPFNDYRTRVFAPTFGYIEDPATGSGNAAFGYYLIKNGMWRGGTITIEQNGFKDRYNIVKLQKQKDEKGNDRVLFGGNAVARIEGCYFLQ
jgi:PhzF family phenazine biosynthesis protein